MKKYPLIKVFTLLSLLAFITIGVTLSLFITSHIKDDHLINLKEHAKLTLKIVTEKIEKSDMIKVWDQSKQDSITSEIQNNMDTHLVNKITLLNKDMIAVLSTDHSLLGKPIEYTRFLYNIFNTNSFSTQSDNTIINNANFIEETPEYFSIYEPLILNDKVEGTFILQISSNSIISHTNILVQTIIFTLAGGLVLLFSLLIGILFRTSQTLINQNSKLISQKSKIEASYIKLNNSYKNTVIALSNAVDARDPYTAGHSLRVSKIALLLGKAISLSDEKLKNLEYAALFHDIGKLGVPDIILNKKDKLTEEEYGLIKKHPEIGVTILEKIDFLAQALPILKHHHERYCGNGYPDHIHNDEIPLEARIIAIADTYDAITTDRPYRKGCNHNAAVEEIIKNKGTQFDGKLVDIFFQIQDKIQAFNQNTN